MKVSIPSRPIPCRCPWALVGAPWREPWRGRPSGARPKSADSAGAQAEDLSLSGPGDGVLHGALNRWPAGKYLRAHTLGPERW